MPSILMMVLSWSVFWMDIGSSFQVRFDHCDLESIAHFQVYNLIFTITAIILEITQLESKFCE